MGWYAFFHRDTVATLVTAVIDWKTYSVNEFQNHKLRKGRSPEFVAKLKGEGSIRIEVGEMRDSLLIADLPWQRLRTYRMNPAEWESFKRKKLGE